jgi:hypothetical protein
LAVLKTNKFVKTADGSGINTAYVMSVEPEKVKEFSPEIKRMRAMYSKEELEQMEKDVLEGK